MRATPDSSYAHAPSESLSPLHKIDWHIAIMRLLKRGFCDGGKDPVEVEEAFAGGSTMSIHVPLFAGIAQKAVGYRVSLMAATGEQLRQIAELAARNVAAFKGYRLNPDYPAGWREAMRMTGVEITEQQRFGVDPTSIEWPEEEQTSWESDVEDDQ